MLDDSATQDVSRFARPIGKRIRTAREARGMSQAAFARKLEKRPATVCSWETGAASPSIETLLDVAQALECSAYYLLGGLGGPGKVNSPLDTANDLEAPVTAAEWLKQSTPEAGQMVVAMFKATTGDRYCPVPDDAMAPILQSGDIVIYRNISNIDVAPGNLVVVHNSKTGKHYIRQYKQIFDASRPGATYELIAHNTLFASEHEAPHLQLLGVVLQLACHMFRAT